MIYKLKENRVSRTYLGGKSIDSFLGKEKCEDCLFPEDWTASTVTAYNSTDGKCEGIGHTEDGISLVDIVENDKLGILVKLLNSAERLVIQAHPTVSFAKEFLNSDYGKTEMWYFLECDEDAYIYIGFNQNAKRSDWEKAFYDNDSEKMLSMLHRLPVKKGDFVFVDGGVPHAIGKGCFMIELQEPSDLMVVNERFTPSGRQIPEQRLHMGLGYEKMFDVYDYTGYSLEDIKRKYCPPPTQIGDGVYEIAGKSLTDKFSMYLLKGNAVLKSDKKYKIAIVTDGEGTICNVKAKRGDRLFIKSESSVITEGNDDFNIVICE